MRSAASPLAGVSSCSSANTTGSTGEKKTVKIVRRCFLFNPFPSTSFFYGSAANSQHCGGSSGSSNPVGVDVVEPGAEGGFMYVEDMELMLMRACSFFGIGSLLLVPQEINSNNERVLFGFAVILPHNGRDFDLVAHGPLCYEECFARQEVSFTMLDKILSTTGYTVCNYNYRILRRVKEHLNQDRVEEVGRLNAQIHILEKENEELLGQVEMFGEMLEE